MAISGSRVGIAFDQRIRGNACRPRITLVRIGTEVYDDSRLRCRFDLIGDADRGASILTRAEIGMEGCGGSNESNYVVGVGVDGSRRYIGVPKAIRGKWDEAIQTGAGSRAHGSACRCAL